MTDNLTGVAEAVGAPGSFAAVDWLRDEGRHGGGMRYVSADSAMFNRASVNVSAVHYDDLPDKRLSSATALSTIIHPQHPRAPSFHMHISWTELRDGSGYWRVMADLNPSIADPDDTATFESALRAAAPDLYEAAAADGAKYFFIPALQRHRGVAHYYLEGYATDDFDADRQFAQRLGEAAADAYAGIVRGALTSVSEPSIEDQQQQIQYHSLYLLQVLTLDRGTTSGLLVHNQNDLGILGSLPARVDRDLLSSWVDRLPVPQNELLRQIVATLADTSPSTVDDKIRTKLAAVVRAHYRAHPEALSMQASGSLIPPTVDNHTKPNGAEA